jgi:outer membrane protein TolC
MKSVNLGFAAALLVLLASFAAQAQSPVAPAPVATSTPAVSAAIASADAAVQQAQANLAKADAAYAAGVASQASVLDAQKALAQARAQAALIQNQQDAAATNLGEIIKKCVAQLALAQQQYQAGVVDRKAVIDAQIALEKAQSRADLYKTVISEKEMLSLTQHLYRVGAASQADLDKAQADLKKAQDAFQAAQP